MADLAAHPALRRMEVPLADGTRVTMPRPPGRTTGFTSGAVPEIGTATEGLRAEFLPV